ncbi:MAG: O-antigen ligase family protein [Clostridiales bacterium]|nr:O-antigen ligase family protein [Clostridiales bacterium]
MTEALKKISDTVSRFVGTVSFLVSMFVLACIVVVTHQPVIGLMVFLWIGIIVLICSDDLISLFFPFLLVSVFLIKCFNSYDTFIRLIWMVIPFAAALVINLIRFPRKAVLGPSFTGILAVSVAVTLGGLGKITPSEFFSGVSVYYTLGLGFGMLAAYLFFSGRIKEETIKKTGERFALIMTLVAAFCCFMVLEHYIENISAVIATKSLLDFQWRNNIATMLMLSMPFPFYLSEKKNPYIALGILTYICILFSGSRGGLIFGTVEFALCLIYDVVYDRSHRKLNLAVFSLLLVLVVISSQDIFGFLSKTIDRIFEFKENKIRLGLMRRAVDDFKSNPLFGRGLAYFGNRDIHRSVKFALCWYHSSPFQVIGSFGIFGVVCYLFQLALRLKIFFERISFFTCTLCVSWVALEMMSLVNPGVFCPVPYLLLLTLMFTIMEKCDKVHVKSDNAQTGSDDTETENDNLIRSDLK